MDEDEFFLDLDNKEDLFGSQIPDEEMELPDDDFPKYEKDEENE